MAGILSKNTPRGRILSHDHLSTRSHARGENSGLHIFTTAEHNQVFRFDTTEQLPWQQRKERMNQAISWIKSEVAFMKVQDKMLTNQFARCQKVIGQLKLRKLREQQNLRKWSAASNDSILQDGLWEDWEIEEFDASESSGDSGDSDTENFKLTAAEKKTKRSRSCDDILSSSTDIRNHIKITRESLLSSNENTNENENDGDVFDISNTTQPTTGVMQIQTNMSAIVNKNNQSNDNNANVPFEEDPLSYSDDQSEIDDTVSDNSDGPLSSTFDDITIEIDDDDITSTRSSSIESLVNRSLQHVTVNEDGYISFDMSLDDDSSYTGSDQWSTNGDDNKQNTNDTTTNSENTRTDDIKCSHVNPTGTSNEKKESDSEHDADDETTDIKLKSSNECIEHKGHYNDDTVFTNPQIVGTHNNDAKHINNIKYVAKGIKDSLSPPGDDRLNTTLSPTRDIWVLYV